MACEHRFCNEDRCNVGKPGVPAAVTPCEDWCGIEQPSPSGTKAVYCRMTCALARRTTLRGLDTNTRTFTLDEIRAVWRACFSDMGRSGFEAALLAAPGKPPGHIHTPNCSVRAGRGCDCKGKPDEAPLSERIRRTEFIRNAPVIADEVAALEAKLALTEERLALTEERLKRTISNCISFCA